MRSCAASRIAPAVVVPTYNHQDRVAQVLSDVHALALPMVVVDDGSTDSTAQVIAAWHRDHPDAMLTPVRHDRNRGKAAALRTGFAAAAALPGVTHAVSIDSDGQLDAADIPALLKAAADAPRALVLGCRPAAIPGCPARCQVGRRFASLALLGQTGRRLADTQCGLRVYPLDLVAAVRCIAGRYAFEAEIIARASWAGFEVIEVPVNCRYHPREQRVSHFRPFGDSARQAVVHVRLLLRALLPWTAPGRLRFGGGMRRPLRDLWRWLNPLRCLRDARSAGLGQLELASALAIGVWIGTLPFFGAHTALCMYVAWRLNLHPAAMILGSQVSIPPLGVALAVVSAWVGHLLLTGQMLGAGDFSVSWSAFPRLALQGLPAWLLGSLIVGFVLGMAVFWLTLLVTAPLRRHAAAAGEPA